MQETPNETEQTKASEKPNSGPIPLAERKRYVAPTPSADAKVQAIRDWASI